MRRNRPAYQGFFFFRVDRSRQVPTSPESTGPPNSNTSFRGHDFGLCAADASTGSPTTCSTSPSPIGPKRARPGSESGPPEVPLSWPVATSHLRTPCELMIARAVRRELKIRADFLGGRIEHRPDDLACGRVPRRILRGYRSQATAPVEGRAWHWPERAPIRARRPTEPASRAALRVLACHVPEVDRTRAGPWRRLRRLRNTSALLCCSPDTPPGAWIVSERDRQPVLASVNEQEEKDP